MSSGVFENKWTETEVRAALASTMWRRPIREWNKCFGGISGGGRCVWRLMRRGKQSRSLWLWGEECAHLCESSDWRGMTNWQTFDHHTRTGAQWCKISIQIVFVIMCRSLSSFYLLFLCVYYFLYLPVIIIISHYHSQILPVHALMFPSHVCEIWARARPKSGHFRVSGIF